MRDIRSSLASYGLVPAVVGSVFLIKHLCSPMLGREAPYLMTFGAVVACTWYGRLGPGVLATVLCALGAELLFAPPYSEGIALARSLLRIALYLLEGGLVCWLIEQWRGSQARAQALADLQGATLQRERAVVDDRSKAQDSLRQREQQLRLVLDTAPVLIAYCDHEHHYRLVNRTYAASFGLAPEQLVGKRLAEVVGAEAYQRIKPRLDAVFAGQPQEFEIELPFPEMGSRVMHCSFAPDTPVEGRIEAMVAIISDVTERQQIQEKLKRRERELLRLVENIPDVIYRLDLDLRHLFVSPAAQQRSGVSADACLGRTRAEAGMPREAALLLDEASRVALATGEPGQLEYRCHDPQGTRLCIDRLVPERDGAGRVVSLLGISTDITRRKRSEDDLLRFKAMSDSSPDVCFCADAESAKLTHINHRAGANLGYTEEEMRGLGLADIHDRFDLEKYAELGRDLAAKKFVAPYETTFKRRDGTSFPVEVTWNALEFDGRPHLCGVARDISERRQAEETLRISRERLDLVVQSTGLGLWYCDLPFDKLVWNDRCKEHFGVPLDTQVTIDTFYERLHPDDRQRTREAIERSIQTGAPFDLDYRTVTPQGSVRWLRAIGRCFFSPQGKPERFDGVTVDASERKRVEEDLQEADRRKNEFLALLSHELRNPLAAIRNALYLLDPRGTDDPSLREAWEMLDRQSGILASLVDDLLDVFRITHQKVSLHREHLDLVHLARLAVGDLHSALEHQGLTIVGDFPAAPVWVVADRTRLTQVVMNVLNNAAKYTRPGGQVRVVVSADKTARRALLQVKDSGVGIAPEMQPHIFDAFCQGELGLARTQGGLGLGLALVKGLVELHGGTVSVASAGIGLGSTFTVSLPLSSAPHGQNSLATLKPPHLSAAPSAPKLRILIVEDNRDTARSLRTILQRYGHEVEMAHDGAAGVERSLAWKPDVVLCDLGLPELDGYQVARALRAAPDTAGVRLIAVSGYGLEDDRRRTTEAGFDLHLIKPVDPLELQRLLSVLKVGI